MPTSPHSVRGHLFTLNALFLASAIIGVVGALGIVKGAHLLDLNYLHVEYTFELHDEAKRFARQGLTDPAPIKAALQKVREQPRACVAIAGPVERVVMRLAGTLHAIEICKQDIQTADAALRVLQSFEQGQLGRSELVATIDTAVETFRENSDKFRPLTSKTVSSIFNTMISLLVLKGIIAMIVCAILSRIISLRHDALVKAQTSSSELNEALRESQERFARAIDASADGMWDGDMQTMDFYYSPTFKELLGYSEETWPFEQLTLDTMVHPDDLDEHRRIIRDAISSGGSYESQTRLKCADGNYRWFRTRGRFECDDEGLPVRTSGSVSDIGELVESCEKAEEANRLKTEFLANMSHEIRTPMNGVLGLVSALRNSEINAQQRQMLEIVTESGETLMSIIDDILDLSKIEAGEMSLERQEFQLEDVLEKAEALYTPLAKDKELTFVLQIHPEVSGRYVGDPGRIRQVLHNLLSNAIKFTDKGCVSIEVSKVANKVRFAVADTGIGIAEREQEDLFAAFHQLRRSASEGHSGTGLGLAICKKLCELMGGTISVKSVLGKGSTFTFDIPLTEVNDQKSESCDTSLAMESSASHRPPLHILAADDNKTNRLVLSTMLEAFGDDVVFVENGADAVEAWQSSEFDLILMDIRMPEVDGVEATKRIRAQEEKGARAATPIIALTANAMKHHVEEYLAAGMNDCVSKPIKVDDLHHAILQNTRLLRSANHAQVA